MTELDLVRLHVSAVWGVPLPALRVGDVETLPGEESLSQGLHPDEVATWSLYLARTALGEVRIWRGTVAATARGRLVVRGRAALARPEDAPEEPGITCEVAMRRVAVPTMDLDTAQRIARPIARSERELVNASLPGWADYYLASPPRLPVFGAVVAGRLLSVAHSSRRTDEACELGVETLPEARWRRLALAVTVSWAETVAAEGLVPLYSALAGNLPSLALAQAAGYRPFAHAAQVDA